MLDVDGTINVHTRCVRVYSFVRILNKTCKTKNKNTHATQSCCCFLHTVKKKTTPPAQKKAKKKKKRTINTSTHCLYKYVSYSLLVHTAVHSLSINKKKSKNTPLGGLESTPQVTFRSAKIANDFAGRGHAHLLPQCVG